MGLFWYGVVDILEWLLGIVPLPPATLMETTILENIDCGLPTIHHVFILTYNLLIHTSIQSKQDEEPESVKNVTRTSLKRDFICEQKVELVF